MKRDLAGVACASLLALGACEREERMFSEAPPAATARPAVTQSDLRPGPYVTRFGAAAPYDDNAYAIMNGKLYYAQFNCAGCHAWGGGSIGPPLMDDQWIYGSEPENIFHTIVEGRPNGMPAFRGKLGNQQVWQLVSYVRSLSGLTPMDARPSRDDAMQMKSAEIQTETERPVQTTRPNQ